MRNTYNYKKLLKKGVNSILCFGLCTAIVFSVTGCKDTKKDGSKVKSSSEASADENDVSDGEAVKVDLSEDDAIIADSKSETISVKLEDNKIKKVTVDSTLKGVEGDKTIKDFSILSDIKNTEGDEEFNKKGDMILWENNGEDIKYQGTLDPEKLPVDVKITYFLDGKEISPKELAGKSGKVKIRFDYENKVKKEVEVKDKKYEVNVPFTFISAVVIPEEGFSNIKVKNGKLMDMNDTRLAVGIGVPGLKESLKLDDLQKDFKKMKKKSEKKSDEKEEDDEIKFPEYVEVKADVVDFELDFTVTMVTKGIFSGIDEDIFDSGYSFTKGMEKLAKGTNKLEKGADKLYDGSEEFKDYLSEYVNGVSSLKSGTASLSEGLGTLDKNSDNLVKGSKQMTKALKKIKKMMKSMDMSAYAAIPEMQPLIMALNSLESGISELGEGSEQLTEGIKQYTDGVGKAYDGSKTLVDGANQISSGGYELVSGYSKIVEGLEKYSDGIHDYNEDVIKVLTKLEGEDLKKVLNQVKALKKADKAYSSVTGSVEGQDTSTQIMFETEEIS